MKKQFLGNVIGVEVVEENDSTLFQLMVEDDGQWMPYTDKIHLTHLNDLLRQLFEVKQAYKDSPTFQECAGEVEKEWQMSGLSEGMYFEYAEEVMKKYLAG